MAKRWTTRSLAVILILATIFWQVSYGSLPANNDVRMFSGDLGLASHDYSDDATIQQIISSALHHEQSDAMYVLAMLKFYGQHMDRDVPGAVRLLKQLGSRGHRDAEFTLGVLYGQGASDLGGPQRNDRTSAAWLSSSANHGHADAKWMLGTMYNEGRGVPQDTQRALSLLVDAATNDINPHGMFHLGVMYEYGHGVQRDVSAAASLYQQASDLDVIDATYYLALMTLAGRGVRKSTPQAIVLLKKAADRGHAPAMALLGELYASGTLGVSVDYGLALRYFKSASTSGDVRVSGDATKKASELASVLAQADLYVQQQERVLGTPLHVEVATVIESR